MEDFMLKRIATYLLLMLLAKSIYTQETNYCPPINDIPVISYEDIQDTDYEIILDDDDYIVVELDGDFYLVIDE